MIQNLGRETLTIVLCRVFKVKIAFSLVPSCQSSRHQSGVCQAGSLENF